MNSNFFLLMNSIIFFLDIRLFHNIFLYMASMFFFLHRMDTDPLSIKLLSCSLKEGSVSSLTQTTLVNRLTMSKLTMELERMENYGFTKEVEAFT